MGAGCLPTLAVHNPSESKRGERIDRLFVWQLLEPEEIGVQLRNYNPRGFKIDENLRNLERSAISINA